MEFIESCLTGGGSRRVLVRLMQTAALLLVVLFACQARAADQREVRSRVAPVYPEIAKRMKITGIVSIEATVEPNGKVASVKTINGSRTLSPAAEAAVMRWQFVPSESRSTVEVQVNFALSD
jgi:TonB family protein